MSRRSHRAGAGFVRHSAIAMLCLALLAGARAQPARAARSASACGGSADRTMQCLINAARGRLGVHGLRDSPALDRAARLKAQAIERCRAFSHTPCGRAFTSVYVAAGYPVSKRTIAENLEWGTGSRGAPAFVLKAWLGSPGHRRNLLDPRFRELGLCAVGLRQFLGRSNVTIWVASFGG